MPEATTVVVFLFMLAIIGGVMWGSIMFARWENRQTKREIDAAFSRLRKQLRGQL